MNIKYLTKVRRIFASYDASPETVRSYQRQWVRAVRRLGDRWLVAHPVQRLEL